MVQATLLLMLSAVTAPPSDAILIEFSSPQCVHCETMQPVIAELQKQGVPVRRVDVNRERELAIRYKIQSTPTFVIVSGGSEKTRLVGAQPLQELQRALHSHASPQLTPTRSVQPPAPPVPETRLASATGGSEAMPSMSLTDAVQRAEAATVRLRVHDEQGFGVGTGTIIDQHGEDALVLTCGHLFRDSGGKGKVEAEIFYAGQIKTVPGRVLSYDAGDRDIALVVIQPGVPIEPIQVLPKNETVRNGQSVFSFGCDRGADPSRRDTRVTGVDKYNQNKGASNIEIAGAPIDGRSGGGLFDEQGRLIAVCNAADHEGDVGIYTGPRSVYWQLDQVNLSQLYQQSAPSGNRLAELNRAGPGKLASLGPSDPSPMDAGNTAPVGAPTGTAADQQMIVIYNDGGQKRMITLDDPPAELRQLLNQHR
ncbi:Thioredoxin-1 [Roseimaritima multifibrata]|uniref:Thioredoxin-1 n=1 Tax=Roseimaritima multifibrata TaxID=1930274 RepID=A0A517MCV1_9BACT|nr:trypsin-like peptidase domain-containing protein [Roseimaritima multifibrata]QDS92718.1 Thioredoxin-1 [Roseimaritima multifibrata]